MDLELQLINVNNVKVDGSIENRVNTWFINNLKENNREIIVEEIDRMVIRCNRLIRLKGD